LRNSKGKEGILLQSTKAIVRRDLTGRSTMRWGTYLKRYGTLYLLLLVPLAFFIIFRYVPMSYILLAFKKNNILKAPWLLDWAKNGGWEWFIKAFNDKNFIDALKNTIILNLLDLVIGTPMPILMALLLNELAFPKFKRVAQTVLYLPHFLSWVIISSLSLRLLATNDGLVNQIFGANIAFLGTENNWRATYIVLGIWKECGWNTIIYLAALTGISPELYEAAAIDGAGIWQRIIHIMIPAIKKLAGTLLILQIISVFQIMYEPMVLTKGGPDNASLSLMQLMWQYAFGGSMNYGKASAVAVIVTLILLVMTAIYSYFDRKESDWD
jgi:putative aldouronate transport system permease protein